jgi:hypothetical protein
MAQLGRPVNQTYKLRCEPQGVEVPAQLIVGLNDPFIRCIGQVVRSSLRARRNAQSLFSGCCHNLKAIS